MSNSAMPSDLTGDATASHHPRNSQTHSESQESQISTSSDVAALSHQPRSFNDFGPYLKLEQIPGRDLGLVATQDILQV